MNGYIKLNSHNIELNPKLIFMKRNTTLAFVLALLIGFSHPIKAEKQLKGQITLSGAFALYPLVVKWAAEFKKLHPEVKIDVSAGGAGKGITDALAGVVDFGMVSREIRPEEVQKGVWAFGVAKDAVLPTINSKNPKLKELLAKGISQATATRVFVSGELKTWGEVLGNATKIPIHLYNRSDACGAGEIWAKYLGGKKQEDLLGTAVFGDPGVASAVQKDPLAFGSNNISYAYDQKAKHLNPGIQVLPLDVNNNGKIDAAENFYSTSTQLIKAIAEGKYPSPPARDLFLVSHGKPTRPEVVAFLQFVLTQGQQYVVPNGYINLPNEKIKAGIKKLK